MSSAAINMGEASLQKMAKTRWRAAERAMRDQPLRTVALAIGAGYVVGGGLFSGLTARLLAVAVKVGLRASALPLVATTVSQWVAPAFDTPTPAKGGGSSESRRRS